MNKIQEMIQQKLALEIANKAIQLAAASDLKGGDE